MCWCGKFQPCYERISTLSPLSSAQLLLSADSRYISRHTWRHHSVPPSALEFASELSVTAGAFRSRLRWATDLERLPLEKARKTGSRQSQGRRPHQNGRDIPPFIARNH